MGAASGRARVFCSGVAPMNGGVSFVTIPRVPASILIVDDHAGFRTVARRLLQSEGFDVVGEAEDGASALAAVRRLHPDVVLLDVQLPDLDGFEVARRIAADDPVPVLILTSTRDRSDFRARLHGTPARGFIGKAELSGARVAELVGCAR